MTKKGKRKRQRLQSVARHQSGQQEIERKCPDQISEDNDSDDDHTNNNEELLEGDGHGKCLRKKKKKRKKKKRRMESSTATLNNCNVTLPSKETKLCSPPDIFTGNEHKIAPAAAAKTADDGKTVPSFPFPTEADDHCETPVNSYRDIVPLLQKISSRINGTASSSNSSLRIYDPYYCNGAMVEHMAQVGFPNVYNRKEDCYSIWSSSKCPVFDVLVTNPPYSGDHIAQLMQHVTAKQFGDRPWLLLLPQWVHKKNYYVLATKHIRPFYLVPTKRYVYIPPKHFRDAKKSDVHKKSSPFCSMWYVWGGSAEFNETLIQHYHRTYKKGSESAPCALARSKSALRDLRRKKS